MSTHSTLNPESFQKLLASAFLVQESGLDTRSLSALVELQRVFATCKFDVDDGMHLIAEAARNVAKATGIAIGLVTGDQLVYRAVSGSAATYLGQHVMATLSASPHHEASEILRVENAQTDTRIEAAICRQFGAKALLILPICRDRALVGVLEVLFSEAHAFQDREVRAYQLMAALLVGEVMSHATQPKKKQPLIGELSTMRQSIEQIPPQTRSSLSDGGSLPGAVNNPPTRQACGDSIAANWAFPPLRQPAWSASMMTQGAKRVTLYRRQWRTGVAVAAVLVIASWIAYRDRHPASPLGASALQSSNAIPSANSASKPQTAPAPMEEARKAAGTIPRWVRVGNNEVDYVAQDVTVRYFTPKPRPQQMRVGDSHVAYLGEDVTVRRFTPKPAVVPRSQRVDR